jgi:PAS domain S-box-containing protein
MDSKFEDGQPIGEPIGEQAAGKGESPGPIGEPLGRRRDHFAVLRVVSIYLLFSILWILFSDSAVGVLARSEEQAQRLQTSKGLFFVGASACLLYALMRGELSIRRRAERARALSEWRFRQIFASSSDALLLLDDSGGIRDLNPTAEHLCQAECSRFTTLGALFAEDQSHRLDEALAEARAEGRARREGSLQRGDGSLVPVELDITKLELLAPLAFLAALRDISLRQQREAQVARLHGDLERHAEELEQRIGDRTAELARALVAAQAADRLKSAFLATMSHELRTPLNSIIGFSGILRQGLAGPLNGEQAKQLGMVSRSAEHLLSLINDLLDISKIEAGQLSLHLSPFSPDELVNKVLATVAPLATAKNLQLNGTLPAGLTPLLGDRRRVEQVLLNLLSNAIKFTDKGQVWVELGRQPAGLEFAVRDTGPGIAEAQQALVFEPFARLDQLKEGTGLGLSISKRLVQMMGGCLTLQSRPGCGSRFSFVLPFAGPPAFS